MYMTLYLLGDMMLDKDLDFKFICKERWWHFCGGLSSIEGLYTRVSFKYMPTFLGEIGQGRQR